jgi:hypothetical protein
MAALPSRSENVFNVVRDVLARQMIEQSGERLKNLETIQTISRPYSVVSILAVSTDVESYLLVLKRYTNNPLNSEIIVTDPDQANNEFNILKHLNTCFSTVEGCSVPHPIAVIPELDAYVMKHVDGHDLVQDFWAVHYFSRRAAFNQLQEQMRFCGLWLKHFQQFTGTQHSDPSILDRILGHCDSRLRTIEESGDPRCPRDFRRNAIQFIEDQVKSLSDTEILVTGCHSDFGPWNTMVGPNGVTVIDFFGYHHAPFPVDVLSVLVNLECLRYGIANSASRLRKLREHFLLGLGPLPKVPQPLVLLCEAQRRIITMTTAVLVRSGEEQLRRIRRVEFWEQSRSLSANVKWFQMGYQESSLWPR